MPVHPDDKSGRWLRGIWAMSLLVVWPGGLCLAADDPPGAYQSPSPEPSPLETLMLEYINRCRANPPAEAKLLVQGKLPSNSVDLEMFQREMAAFEPVPPVVFDLPLLKAARWHSYYNLKNGLGHIETPGRPGFTGRTPSERVRRAGAAGTGASENATAGMNDPWICHSGFVMDVGLGPGGMQPERGHRRNILDRQWRIVGVGAVPDNGNEVFACTHNFTQSSQRWVGGVVLNDRNRNRFYDIGEGISGIPLATSEGKLNSWQSGAYALPIPTESAKLTVKLDGKAYAVILPAGQENVKFDVYLSSRGIDLRASALFRRLKRIPDTPANEARRLPILIDLAILSRTSFIDEHLLEDLQKLVEPVRQMIQEEQEIVRQAIQGGDARKAHQVTRAALQKFAKTNARRWFADAATCARIKEAYDRMLSLRSSGKALSQDLLNRTVGKQLQQYQQLSDPEWKTLAWEWGQQTAALGQPGAPNR